MTVYIIITQDNKRFVYASRRLAIKVSQALKNCNIYGPLHVHEDESE